MFPLQELALTDADAMLAGEAAPDLDAEREDVIARLFGLPRLLRVREDQDLDGAARDLLLLDPDAILADVVAGIPADPAPMVERDRALAIRHAIEAAAPEDLVLIAGKGHEDYQIIGAERRPFSDAAAVRDALAARSPA